MTNVTIKQLLEAGVHFGQQTQRWNPKMAPFIFTERNNIHIIDLQKALKGLKKAYVFVRERVSKNESIIFVGTKRQAAKAIKEEAIRCGMFYVDQRWLGGTLTNFTMIRRSVARLKELERMEKEGTLAKFTKKEGKHLRDEMAKLERVLGGIKEMERLPDIIFVVDTIKERIAISEARRLGIPVVAIVDTNSDPDEIDYPIPGNDDAIRAVKLITSVIADAVCEGVEIKEEIVVKGDEGEDEDLKEFSRMDVAGSADLLSQMVANIPPDAREDLLEDEVLEESEVVRT